MLNYFLKSFSQGLLEGQAEENVLIFLLNLDGRLSIWEFTVENLMSRQMTVEKNKTKEQQIYLLTYLFSFVTRRTSGVW